MGGLPPAFEPVKKLFLPRNVIPGRSEGPSPEPKHTGIANTFAVPWAWVPGSWAAPPPRNDKGFGISSHALSPGFTRPTVWLRTLERTGPRMVDDMSGAEMPGEMTDGFHLVVEALKLNGVDTIFGVAGIPITDLLALGAE